MQKFEVKIVETLSRIVTVNADSAEQALQFVNKEIDNEGIVLDSSDYDSRDIMLLSPSGLDTTITFSWGADDVINRAEEMECEFTVTLEDAAQILQLLEHGHDCNLGITWEIIDMITLDYFEDKQKTTE